MVSYLPMIVDQPVIDQSISFPRCASRNFSSGSAAAAAPKVPESCSSREAAAAMAKRPRVKTRPKMVPEVIAAIAGCE